MPVSPSNSGQIPETPVVAPTTSPALPPTVLFVRCTENRVEDDYDGGLVLLQGVKGQLPEIAGEVLDARLVLSARHDAFMRQFPVTRDEKQSRFFKLTIEEVSADAVPPDPDATPELFNRAGQRVDANGNLLR